MHKNNSRWILLLGVLGSLIVLITMYYSQFLAKELKDREEATVELFAEAVKIVAQQENTTNDNTMLETTVLTEFGGIMPIILEDESGKLEGFNYEGDDTTSDQKFLEERKQKLLDNGFIPLNGYGSSHKIYYEHSFLYTLIAWFPIAQFLLLSTFVLFGYFLFSASRKSEENRIWAGMAKETAHQLGTPISAIVGWIEHLKSMAAGNQDFLEVANELEKDVDRLDLIADRFSKIGSKPELTKINIIDELSSSKTYMAKRASRKVVFDFETENVEPVYCQINSHLFNWVLENLLRNALDAMEGKGTISAKVVKEGNWAHIDVSDTGKGMTSKMFKTVFQPGFTTKKRGWGLGLSLAKRIIENYHKGKIYVKSSKINEGTTFTIQLPLA